MAVKLISVDHDGTRGIVCFEAEAESNNFANAINELKSGAVRNEAIKQAAVKGLPDPRVEINPAPYAVDPEGNMVERPQEQTIAAYRIDIPVVRKLV